MCRYSSSYRGGHVVRAVARGARAGGEGPEAGGVAVLPQHVAQHDPGDGEVSK